MARIGKRRAVVLGALLAAVVLVGAGLYWFQPWKLWTDETVNEPLPSATVQPLAPTASLPPGATQAPSAPEGPRTLAQGELISHEHTTTGTVKIVQLPDGSRTLRLENLDTSNGPDLQVWLTDAPVKEGVAGWRVFDDGKYVRLGRLKGNKGDQNYPIPAAVQLADYTSVSIWCDRFDVSFGAANLRRN
ncbi:DM13 domain-containing protein [Streptomyces sp. DSM 40907]|uniref:DM13 domain-containing protein n=1 Tax=Streptomyces kutzneri TaxID=3051179 RepID=UPI0028D57CAC|nr:DM13 domain-containing protein [Streptomyces sp. DSM 40907]